MKPFTTMSIAFQPDRPGNWLFHCHIGFHVLSMARLGETQHDDHASADAGRHMAGLVLGLTVRPERGWKAPPRESPRAMRLIVQEGERRGRASRALSFVLQSGAAEPAADSVELPGSMLVLTRDEPTDITVVNRLREPTAVHWHGIELESYSDGVVGFSGEGRRVAPPIAPGDSFTARLTLRRSGTFIYHTHLNDLDQLTSGLYGAIIVIDPASRFDAETDRVFIAGWDGDGEPPRLIVNGDSTPPPLDFVRGAEYRLRFVNIGPAASFRALLTRSGDTATWRPRAKDGADVPNHARTERPSVVIVDVGETADFDFIPARTGDYTLTFAHAPTLPPVVQQIRVR
jgi:FtsP/CotA-like multicopper oxidase with cupredoxin domain